MGTSVFGKLRRTLRLNKFDLSEQQGARFYANKIYSSILSGVYLFLAVALPIVLFKQLSSGEQVVLICVMMLFAHQSISAASFLLLKNPIFIVTENELFYLLSGERFPLDELSVEEKFSGRGTYVVIENLEAKVVVLLPKNQIWQVERFLSTMKRNQYLIRKF